MVAIENLSLVGKNYQVAWGILNRKYENKRILIEGCIKSLIHAKPTIEKNAESILRFTQTYQQALHNLNSLDVDPDHASFIVLIMEKIDPYTFSRFEDFCSNSSELPTICLLKFILVVLLFSFRLFRLLNTIYYTLIELFGKGASHRQNAKLIVFSSFGYQNAFS